MTAATALPQGATQSHAPTPRANGAAPAADGPVSGGKGAKRDANGKRRRRKKKAGGAAAQGKDEHEDEHRAPEPLPEGIEIEYVAETPAIDGSSELAEYFGSVFAKFEPVIEEAAPETEAAGDADGDGAKSDSDSDNDGEGDDGEGGMSNRKLRKAARLTVAELKQLVDRPEVVDWVDVTATDPTLLVAIKSLRNTVPVPVHWSQKRKYLQNKRGLEKDPFKLPDFIIATGILEMRETQAEKDGDARLKQKTRERTQPKMGKLVLDYGKLHDAFFKWQTKPSMTAYGEMYYEGREFETKLKNVRPGAPLSPALREALNMPSHAPPPYLANMQRHGPPPSYPGLKIPGLNAPIPPGASWGFHPGGWGKPPVDEYGRPLYGDVYGTAFDPMAAYREAIQQQLIQAREAWGEIPEADSDDEEDEDEDRISGDDEEDDEEAAVGDEDARGAAPVHARAPEPETLPITSYGRGGAEADDDEEADLELEEFVQGLVTPAVPDDLDLRKGSAAAAARAAAAAARTEDQGPRELYTVIEERAPTSSANRSGLLGSEHVYDIRKRPAPGTETETPMPGAQGAGDEAARKKRRVDERGSKRREFKF
ncbi:hypothetical protein H9P43_000364 [Blastocladiella emersonii ATCC 22665]|nr:hypothetical protein H9P43_000364 [Blastocladiella emersonii ATCC 22665]